jgi:hypothetical protein
VPRRDRLEADRKWEAGGGGPVAIWVQRYFGTVAAGRADMGQKDDRSHAYETVRAGDILRSYIKQHGAPSYAGASASGRRNRRQVQ